jgi:hypothetical protein
MTDGAARLDQTHVAFIESGGTIYVASRDGKLRATVAYGLGCHVSPQRDRITVFLAASWCEALLASVAETRALAVCFAEPGSHKTLQIKGSDAVARPLTPDERATLPACIARLIAKLGEVGVPEELVRTVTSCDPAELRALTFSPAAAFSQTPGPQAGSRLNL